MTNQQAGRGVRVRVTANTVNARRPGEDGAYLQPGDEITLTGRTHVRPDGSLDHYYDRGHGFRDHYVKIAEIELLGPRVKKPPVIDIWEAARGYIR